MTDTVKDKKKVDDIISILGNKDSIKIIRYLLDKSDTIRKIKINTRVPNESAYRKIKKIIKTGMIVQDGYTTVGIGKKKKRVKKYTTLFNTITINIAKDASSIRFTVKKRKMSNDG